MCAEELWIKRREVHSQTNTVVPTGPYYLLTSHLDHRGGLHWSSCPYSNLCLCCHLNKLSRKKTIWRWHVLLKRVQELSRAFQVESKAPVIWPLPFCPVCCASACPLSPATLDFLGFLEWVILSCMPRGLCTSLPPALGFNDEHFIVKIQLTRPPLRGLFLASWAHLNAIFCVFPEHVLEHMHIPAPFQQ